MKIMKKIFSSLICLSIVSSNFAFAQLLEDNLVNQLDKNLKISFTKYKILILLTQLISFQGILGSRLIASIILK